MAVTLTTSYQKVAEGYIGNTGYFNVYLRLYAKYNSQSIANNTTSVSYKSAIYLDGNGTFWSNSGTTKSLYGDGATGVSNANANGQYGAYETTLNEITGTVTHDSNGSKTVYTSANFTSTVWGWNTSVDASCVLPTIPRYATSNQSLNAKTETTIKMNWSSDNTIDYIWYSKDNGSNWTGVDVTDGTSGTYTISGLSANTTYTIKTRVRRKDSQLTTDSSALSVTTYKVPTNSLNSRTETTIKMNWSVDSTADYIWYSKDNGSTWTGVDVTDGTSGTYTISGLSANTTYKIKTRVRRKATQTTYDCSVVSVTTYDFPYCNSTPNFTIGNAVTIGFYNPLGRKLTWEVIGNDGSLIGTNTDTTGTSYTGLNSSTSINNFYASIPNLKSGTYKIKVTYSSSTKTKTGGTYSIKGDEKPTFTNFTYADTDATITPLTNNNQILVDGNSDCKFTISTANKAVAKNSATMVSYKYEWGNKSTTGDYSSTSNAEAALYDSTGGTLKITAIDSRGLSTTVTKTVPYISYTSAVVNSVEVQRLNGVDLETYLGLKMTIWKGNWQNGSNTAYDNQLKYVGYRVNDGSSWTGYFDITSSVKNAITSYTSGSSTVITLPLSKKIPIHANGSSGGFTVGKSYTIQVLIKDGTSTATFTPYSYQATAQGTVPDGKVGFSRYKDSDGNYHYAINSMPNDKYTLLVNGKQKLNGNLYLEGMSGSAAQSLSKLIFGNADTQYVTMMANTSKQAYFSTSATALENAIGYKGNDNVFGPVSANTTAKLGHQDAPWHEIYAKNTIVALDGSIWANTASSKEIQCGVQRKEGKNAGSVYLYTTASTTGSRGIYSINNAGAGASVITISKDNVISFHGTSSSANKAKVTNTNPTGLTDYYPIWNSGAGDSTDLRANNGCTYQTQEGTTSANGRGLLCLGNSTSTGTAGNKFGCLRLYSKLSGYINLQYADNTGSNTIFFPNYNGNAVISTTGTNYEKLSDGTLIVYGDVTCPALAKNSGTSVTITLPVSFVNTSYRVTLSRTGSGSYWSYVEGSAQTKATGTIKVQFWNNATDQSAACTFDFIAIGKWK